MNESTSTYLQAGSGGFCPYTPAVFDALEAQAGGTGPSTSAAASSSRASGSGSSSSRPPPPLLLLGLTGAEAISPGATAELTPADLSGGGGGANGNGSGSDNTVTRLLLGKGSEAARAVMGHFGIARGAAPEAVVAGICRNEYQGFIAVFPTNAQVASAAGGGHSRERSLSPTSGNANANSVSVKREQQRASPSPSPTSGAARAGGGGGGGPLLSEEECCHQAKWCLRDNLRLRHGGPCRRFHPGDPGFVPMMCIHGNSCSSLRSKCMFYHPDEMGQIAVRAFFVAMGWGGMGFGWQVTCMPASADGRKTCMERAVLLP